MEGWWNINQVVVADTDGMRQKCDGPVVQSEEGLSSAQARLSGVASEVTVGVTPRLI